MSEVSDVIPLEAYALIFTIVRINQSMQIKEDHNVVYWCSFMVGANKEKLRKQKKGA